MDLSTPLQFVKGVGPARASALESKGLNTVEDLLLYPPFRYEDRTNLKLIAQLAPGEMATVIAEVRTARLSAFRRRDLGLFEATFTDASRAVLLVKWFHASYLADVLEPGQRVALYGKVEYDPFAGRLAMLHPEFEILSDEDEADAALHVGRVVPVYEAAGKVTTRVFRRLIHSVLERLAPPPDPLPASIRRRLHLPDLWTALRSLHFPAEQEDLQLLNAFRTAAQIRLIFEEFFWLQYGLAVKKNSARRQAGIAFQLTDRVREQIKRMLPFKPTAAQKRVLAEIARDMARPHPMNRLLQGDVGSGKTLVAAEAAIIAIENGYQVAMLAPTEILAAQHYFYFKRLFQKLGYQVGLLTGSSSKREKMQMKKLLAQGLVHFAVGTHALLEEDVEFQRLGLAIIDEQHRFGVLQRLRFMRKGVRPDVLVMTATPIPRTLALTLYGDLDVSVLDELPPGRKPVITRHVTEDQIERVWSFVKTQIQSGRQAYVVCPAIEESETQARRAAEKTHRHLAQQVFPDLCVGLLHGRMPAEEKEAVMESFKRGEIQLLVSTTVIEVGVDVPNATVMVIEQAERFGLAQLHQLRGRVGRGAEQSYCILVTGPLNDASRERIRTLVESADGFHIAEMDLKLRGPGEFFGTRQAGVPSLRVANILRDSELLELARREAAVFLHSGPEDEQRRALEFLRGHWQRRFGLAQVG
ncbi:MAG: ATP-dependent DNA helicase RecG [Bryobacterales bacterium]|nr:ATP-dependent DNA helicase RecG [Bryobacteraceae bacterium]MDW8130423.1 ATP-dependent DNA helicase RecG [Bryobacterales bacterium]